MKLQRTLMASLIVLALALTGCRSDKEQPKEQGGTTGAQQDKGGDAKKIETERAKFSGDELAAINSQDYCPLMPDKKLGSRGTIFKLDLQGKTVYVCCMGCKKGAEKDPAKALKAFAEMKGGKD